MTGPTREEVEEWVSEAGLDWHRGFPIGDEMNRYETLAALAFAAGSRSSSTAGAELVREIEENPFPGEPYDCRVVLQDYWNRIRTALLSGSGAGEDARDAARKSGSEPDASK